MWRDDAYLLDMLVHDYPRIELPIVYGIVKEGIPDLVESLEKFVALEGGAE